MPRTGRTFLKYVFAGNGTAATNLSWWTASKQRAAHLAHRIFMDVVRTVLPPPLRPNPSTWSDNRITVSWIGHATALLNFYGVHILTDPVFFNRVGIQLGPGVFGAKRYVAPALHWRDLPPIDVVLLSHAHYDHIDLPSLRRIAPNAHAVTAKETSQILRSAPFKQLTELQWNSRTTVRTPKGDLALEAFEVKHWGQRWPSKVPRGYNGYMLRREGKALLFSGDTALTPLFTDIRSRGPFELAAMPIGAYQPWIWNHCTPEQALEMANAAGARYILPIHHQTFRLSDEPMNEPIERLQHALQREPERLALSRIGETFVCPTS